MAAAVLSYAPVRRAVEGQAELLALAERLAEHITPPKCRLYALLVLDR